jgi:hypothetical protein
MTEVGRRRRRETPSPGRPRFFPGPDPRTSLARRLATQGILHAKLGVSPDEAFRLLSRYSQDNNNQRVRKISAGLLEGRITAAELRSGPR